MAATAALQLAPMLWLYASRLLLLLLLPLTQSSTVLPPEIGLGNFPALLRPGPSRRGICLITASEARKAW